MSTGRPKGSKTKERDETTAELSRCQKCGSTERAPYTSKLVQEYAGVIDGKPFTRIVRRRTKCLDCGQHRVDRFYENRPARKRK